jgi:hypothetical protein
MLVFTQAHDWEGDPAVKQVLVFPNQEVADLFDKAYHGPNRPRTASNFPDENGIGAIFKLRAVKNGRGSWDAVVRCGFTGAMLAECGDVGNDWKDAINSAGSLLHFNLQHDLLRKFKTDFQTLHEQIDEVKHEQRQQQPS